MLRFYSVGYVSYLKLLSKEEIKMLFKKKMFFSICLVGLVSPQLMAATFNVPSAVNSAGASPFQVSSIVRPTPFSAVSNVAIASFANQFGSEFFMRPQANFSVNPGLTVDSPAAEAVAISAVPIPAALWLFIPAVLGFFGLRQRSQTANKSIALNR